MDIALGVPLLIRRGWDVVAGRFGTIIGMHWGEKNRAIIFKDELVYVGMKANGTAGVSLGSVAMAEREIDYPRNTIFCSCVFFPPNHRAEAVSIFPFRPSA